MLKPTDGLSQRPAAALIYLECSGVGKAIAAVAGFAFIQRLAVPKITLAGFGAPLTCVHIKGLVR